jgi:hypothetical protein
MFNTWKCLVGKVGIWLVETLVLLEGLFGAEAMLPAACVPGTEGKNPPLPLKILLFTNLWKVIV